MRRGRMMAEAAQNKLMFSGAEMKHYAQHPEERPLPPKGKEKQKTVGEDGPDLLNTAFNLGHKKSPMV